MTREDWLMRLTSELRPMFEAIDFPLPEKIRASCGFPSKGALAKKKRRIGEAWSSDNSEDQTFETFVSPMLSDPVEVAAVQVHELCHCAVGMKCGHRKPFTKVARAIGLEGKMTATEPGEELKATLEGFVEEIGSYPHAKLTHSSSPKKQGTRMLKVVCSNLQCGCVLRMTKKWQEQVGLPICGCGACMKTENTEVPEDEEG